MSLDTGSSAHHGPVGLESSESSACQETSNDHIDLSLAQGDRALVSLGRSHYGRV